MIYFPESEVEMLKCLNHDSTVLNGGTDIMVRKRLGRLRYENLVSLDRLRGLNGITEEKDGIRILCRTTHSDILGSQVVREKFPVLYQAVYEIGSTQIRNRGTLIGNVVNASPAGDGILALYLTDSVLEIISGNGERRNVRIDEFITGPGKTVLLTGEYVRSVKIPYPRKSYICRFRKIGQRKAMAISIASMGVLIEKKGSTISDMKIAFGSVAPTVLRLTELEKEAFGRELNEKNIEMLSRIAFESVSPIDDVRASSDYRRKVCRNLVKELTVLI